MTADRSEPHAADLLHQRVVAMCETGRSLSAVHVAEGRCLFGVEGDAAFAVWGVVDVPANGSGPLVLEPRLHRVPADELRPACRLDAIDGVALTGLPERLRTLRVPSDATSVVVPLGAQYVRLPQ